MSPPATLYKLFMSNSETAILKMLKDWSIDGKNSDKSSLEPKYLVQDQSERLEVEKDEVHHQHQRRQQKTLM